jgi:Flp pilus assembly pilin Flp
MRMFVVAVIAMVVIATGAWFVLETVQKPVDVAFTTPGARIDPGE